MTQPPDPFELDHAANDALIAGLLKRVEALESQIAALAQEQGALIQEHETLLKEHKTLLKENAALLKENAELRARLGKPPKTPKNSSTPPSQGRKASEQAETKSKEKGERNSREGAHRPLHPNPTHRLDMTATRCAHCQADLSGERQWAREAYDHVEIPPIAPIVTRVTLMGGRCSCCGKLFKQGEGAGRLCAGLALRAEPQSPGPLSALRPRRQLRAALRTVRSSVRS